MTDSERCVKAIADLVSAGVCGAQRPGGKYDCHGPRRYHSED